MPSYTGERFCWAKARSHARSVGPCAQPDDQVDTRCGGGGQGPAPQEHNAPPITESVSSIVVIGTATTSQCVVTGRGSAFVRSDHVTKPLEEITVGRRKSHRAQ